MKKKQVAIIGVGLIGGSLGMALKKSRKFNVLGIGRHRKKLETAKKLKALDDFTLNFRKGVSGADIIVVSTPVDLIRTTIKHILPFLKKNAIITDVGSVKGSILSGVKNILKSRTARSRNISFIGAHPMAGSEKTGINFASPAMFKGATVVLVKDGRVNKHSLEMVRQMWSKTAANIKLLEAKDHDRAVALVSHLPHVIAFNLCLGVGALKEAGKIASLSAGSFKDMTRVADANPRDWAAICSMNKEEVRKAIDLFIKNLNKTKSKLGDKKALENIFSNARTSRQKLL